MVDSSVIVGFYASLGTDFVPFALGAAVALGVIVGGTLALLSSLLWRD